MLVAIIVAVLAAVVVIVAVAAALALRARKETPSVGRAKGVSELSTGAWEARLSSAVPRPRPPARAM